MDKGAPILITGGTGVVGRALGEVLEANGFTNVVSIGSKDCDLMDWPATRDLFVTCAPHYVFHLAARVYGIQGNLSNKGLSFHDNVLINTHTIEAARISGARKILAMGSGCVYPYPSPGLPLTEDMIWLGKPHAAEDSYAHSKRAMLAQLIAYQEQYDLPYAFVISANLYGPHDRFDTEFGHVTPALVRKFYEARQSGGNVVVWGHGTARRDFMYSADCGRALLAIMTGLEGPVNMGSGWVHEIREIVDTLSIITGTEDGVVWNRDKPDGQDYRSYDLSKLHSTGFRPEVGLTQGLRLTYDWYAARAGQARR